jgi:hypothetical protein
LVIAEQASDQLRFERRILCGSEGEPAGIDRDEKPFDAFFDIGSTIETGRTDRQPPAGASRRTARPAMRRSMRNWGI